MNHRYKEHYIIIKQCLYEEKGECHFKDKCYYKHKSRDEYGGEYESREEQEPDQNDQLVKPDSHTCRVCGNCFSTWPALMVHRKKMHNVKDCTNKNCRFGENVCWYNHSKPKNITKEPKAKAQEIKSIIHKIELWIFLHSAHKRLQIHKNGYWICSKTKIS